MSFLHLNGLRKTYGDGTEAVKGIDLSCAKGEFVVLLGPSGCGKTTTLRMVAGLEKPSAGQIALDGEDIAQWAPAERDVGFVFQFYALYPHMRVCENIAFPLESMGVEKGEIGRRVDEIAGRLKIEALLDWYPQQLSGGDQQRVALGRAMVRRPQLYLMDEPLGTLDSDLRLEMRELIRDQQLQDGVTTLYVTHDQEEAMSLADRIVVMEAGRIRQSGAAAAVYADPADLFVAHFIGSPGMNFIEGEIVDGVFCAHGIQRPLSCSFRAGPTTLGVRPEFMLVSPGGALRGEVLLNEYMGACHYIHLQTPCGRLVLRGQERAAIGQLLELDFSEQDMRFFDTASGVRL
jgi:multiple sugar transport system ATP-binding protein